jgi:uncharacterized damage-inducible protein DinB
MLTPEALRDMHARTKVGSVRLLAHCRRLSPEEFARKLDGFGMASVRTQFVHLLTTEEFWVSVLQGRQKRDEEFDLDALQTLDGLEAYLEEVSALTRAYLDGMDEARLAAPVELPIDDTREVFVPELVVLRVLTHYFHHRAQIAAMVRLLGHPVPEDMLDYPLAQTPPAA